MTAANDAAVAISVRSIVTVDGVVKVDRHDIIAPGGSDDHGSIASALPGQRVEYRVEVEESGQFMVVELTMGSAPLRCTVTAHTLVGPPMASVVCLEETV